MAQDGKSRGVFFDFENQAEEELLSFQEILVCGVQGMRRTLLKLGELNKVLIVLIKRISPSPVQLTWVTFHKQEMPGIEGCRSAKTLLLVCLSGVRSTHCA